MDYIDAFTAVISFLLVPIQTTTLDVFTMLKALPQMQ